MAVDGSVDEGDDAGGGGEDVGPFGEVMRIRARRPGVRGIVRGDGGFCRDELMVWCEGDGVHAGTLRRTAQRLDFQYTVAYLARPRAEPLSKRLPLEPGQFRHGETLRWFDALLPEGARREQAARQAKEPHGWSWPLGGYPSTHVVKPGRSASQGWSRTSMPA